MPGDKITDYAEEISNLLTERLRIKGRSLEQKIYRSGRQMPARIKRDAQSVAQAMVLCQNPKLARMVDQAAIGRAAENVISHLTSIDRAEVMKTRILLATAKVAAFAIVVFVVLVTMAYKRGMI